MPKKKRQPPAKIKYDKTHPVVSIRVDQDLKKKLADIKQISGKSAGDILREAVGVQGKSTKRAYTTGIEHAKIKYGVWYRCSGCGGSILIDSDNEKKTAAQYMKDHGWGHIQCIEKKEL